MSFVKYRLKEVATDFGTTPKEIAEIIGKFGEKPKSNTQVLTDEELKALEDGAADGDLLLDENGDPVLDEDGNPVHSSLASYDSADRHVRDVSYVVTGAAGLSAIVLFILKIFSFNCSFPAKNSS